MDKFPNLFKNINEEDPYCVSNISKIIGIKNDLNLSFIQVPVGVSTKYHNHKDYEVWLINYGEGVVTSCSKDGRVTQVKVCAGDVLLFYPFDSHQITNTGKESLKYVSTWWENWDITEKLSCNAKSNHNENCRLLFVLACPTPNGPLHLGHLSGPYFLADVAARKLELEGTNVEKVTGTFGYTNHITNTATLKNTDYKTLVQASEAQIKADFKNFNLEPNDFITHNIEKNYSFNEFLHKTVKEYMDDGIFFEEERLHFFDSTINNCISEGDVQGICYFCGSEALGIECENCGSALDCHSLLKPTAIFSNNLLEKVERKSLFWRPNIKSLDIVAEHYSQLSLDFGLYIPNTLNKVVDYYKEHPVAISIFQKEGVVLPQYTEQTLSTFAQRLLLRLYWFKEYKDIRKIIFFNGRDNFVCSIFLVSVFLHERFGFLDTQAVTTGFSLLDNKKFSTSKNHAIWAKDFFEQNKDADYLRLYFAYIYRSDENSNFSQQEFKEFQQKYSKLIKEIIASCLAMVIKYNQDITASGSWTEFDRIFFDDLNNFYMQGLKLMDIYSLAPNKFFIYFDALLITTKQYINQKITAFDNLPNMNKKTAVYLSCYALWNLLRLLYPVMPAFSRYYLCNVYGVNDMFNIIAKEMPNIYINDIHKLLNKKEAS